MPSLRRLAALPLLTAMLIPAEAHAQHPGLPVIEIEWHADVSWSQEASDTETSTPSLAQFGPFYIIDSRSAEMRGIVGSATPAQFAAMLRAWPDLETLRMIECPGSDDDEANLKLARMLRAARIETIVPAGGSVRSGAVELFLAGVRRRADRHAEFAVHSWRDELGREAEDLPPDDPVHREYIEFYREMGLSDDSAKQFYALTSSVAFDDALYVAPLHLAAMGLLDVL